MTDRMTNAKKPTAAMDDRVTITRLNARIHQQREEIAHLQFALAQAKGKPRASGHGDCVCDHCLEQARIRMERKSLEPAAPVEDGEVVERLFAATAHGDNDHREWLHAAYTAFFAGQPVPAPRGSGNKEKRIAELEAQLAQPPAADALEVERLRDLLDTERYKVAIGVQAIRKALDGRRWLSEAGRGSYTYDDERYQQEFGAALDEIDAALEPLRAIAGDWSDCPRDPLRVAANREAALAKLQGDGE